MRIIKTVCKFLERARCLIKKRKSNLVFSKNWQVAWKIEGGVFVLDKALRQEIEALNFYKATGESKIKCDDPEISILDVGALRDGVREFVLYLHGRKIGFGTPENLRDFLRDIIESEKASGIAREPQVSKPGELWVIGQIGQKVSRSSMTGQRYVEYASEYHFESSSERNFVLGIILVALETHPGDFFDPEGRQSRVLFTASVMGENISGGHSI